MEFYENEVRPERAFLVSVDTGEFDAEASMSELYELTESAGAQPVGAMIQKREKPDGATCIGSGRLEELKEVCQSQEIDLIIFDCELSPTQIRNLEFETEVRIIDRTMLILDIFASRARSREGKLQVELCSHFHARNCFKCCEITHSCLCSIIINRVEHYVITT